MSSHIPQRTCVACRRKSDKQDFLRIVKKDSGVEIDESEKSDGRGAYVCKNSACIIKAVKSKAFNKSFKCSIDDSFYKNLENYAKNL